MQAHEHARHVDAWMERAAKGLPERSFPALFEKAWAALWRRSEGAIGELALVSISELVLSSGAGWALAQVDPRRAESDSRRIRRARAASPAAEPARRRRLHW